MRLPISEVGADLPQILRHLNRLRKNSGPGRKDVPRTSIPTVAYPTLCKERKEPRIPATQRWTRPRVRLSLRKGA
jgi:hypothetical protein